MSDNPTRLNKSDQFLGATVTLLAVGLAESVYDYPWWLYVLLSVPTFAWGFHHYVRSGES